MVETGGAKTRSRLRTILLYPSYRGRDECTFRDIAQYIQDRVSDMRLVAAGPRITL